MCFTKMIRVALIAAVTTACATSFTGSAHVEEGRAGCERKCKGQGMELAGMVYMGEYSDACVCAVPGKTGSRLRYLASAGAIAGGSAGVVMQMQRQAEQQRRY